MEPLRVEFCITFHLHWLMSTVTYPFDHYMIYLNIVLSSCCGPDPVVVFLQSTEQTHPRLGVGPAPVLPHTLFPQIPQGLIPVIVKELGNLLQMMVCHSVDILAQLL